MRPDAPVVECIPNFSEGRDPSVLSKITDAVESVDGVRLLDVDPGHAAHRTVVTFAGAPEAVTEAAFRAIAQATASIDLRRHQGTHPRLGATDVCPLVPVTGVSMEETVQYARRLARRVGDELAVPVYLYEKAATDPRRRNLAVIRRGQFEGLAHKMTLPQWRPDFGPPEPHPSAGATVIGARDFLVAYNVNLDTKDAHLAHAIACDVRESGRRTSTGRTPGSLQAVKALGWFIEEYDRAQVSMNLTDLGVTSVHDAFEEVRTKAAARGVRVTGSELVGLVPLRAMVAAGRFYLDGAMASEKEMVSAAVESLGLGELRPFEPRRKILEYRLGEAGVPPPHSPKGDAPVPGSS